MRIACIGYRNWALNIYDELANHTDHQFLIFRSKAQYSEQILRDFRPSVVLFYGWSWIVPSAITSEFQCIMLHPSPLPKFRGGSPLQNQIIEGIIESAITLFLMDEGVDTGPILAQKPLSLEGSIHDIFQRIARIGFELTLELLVNGLNAIPQNEDEATVFQRRKPNESEITIDEIRERSSTYLYNKIRMLQSPYPNAFIRTSDGKKLTIFGARIEEEGKEIR